MTQEILGVMIWRRCNHYKDWSPMHIITKEDIWYESINERVIKQKLKEKSLLYLKEYMKKHNENIVFIEEEFKITYCKITAQTRRITKIYSKKNIKCSTEKRTVHKLKIDIK